MMMVRQRSGVLFGLLFCWITTTNAFQHVQVSQTVTETSRNELYASKSPHEERRDNVRDTTSVVNRRSALAWGCGAAVSAATLLPSSLPAMAADTTVAPVTQKVFMNVRISRQDGTFYVRDDLPDIPENQVFYGRLVFGLFGTKAPTAVERFLSYVNVQYSPLDDAPLPSYGRSQFKSLDQATGLLIGGYIPSLELTSFGGSTALQYGGRVLSAPLWIGKDTEKLPHNQKGLLTHKALEVLPTFGITTRSSNPELDGTNIVFGQVLWDDSSRDFMERVQDLPTYSTSRPKGDPRQETPVEDMAAAVFNSQREFFRGAAKTFGDSRLDKVYEGKLLRRVEVTQVGLL